MVCDSWKTKLDTYLDRELPDEEMRAFDAHMRGCASCSADALARVQLKRAIQVAGKRFAPSAEFRRRMLGKIAPKPQRSFRLLWVLAASALAIVVAGALTANYVRGRSAIDHVFSEIADLHVATLASSSPVDVVSTDRHTVKPWFQGKIPFAFDLPELQNSGFTLLGGRMTYLGQTPGAHLIYELRKHRISVFVFPEGALPELGSGENKDLSFSMETWSQGGLRYFVIGDANAGDIDSLAKLFKGGV
jgi:anti-sigma factor RsiW